MAAVTVSHNSATATLLMDSELSIDCADGSVWPRCVACYMWSVREHKGNKHGRRCEVRRSESFQNRLCWACDDIIELAKGGEAGALPSLRAVLEGVPEAVAILDKKVLAAQRQTDVATMPARAAALGMIHAAPPGIPPPPMVAPPARLEPCPMMTGGIVWKPWRCSCFRFKIKL